MSDTYRIKLPTGFYLAANSPTPVAVDKASANKLSRASAIETCMKLRNLGYEAHCVPSITIKL